jgi:1-acyl-sn-glycerol-3-phosphate acyltransferase
MKQLGLTLRSTLFYLVYVSTLVLHALIWIPLGLLLPVKRRFVPLTSWNRFIIWWLAVSCNIRLRVQGTENIPPDPFVLLSNHQSPWETVVFYYFFRPITAILKKELMYIPLFGWGLSLLHPIPIDRSNIRQARQTVLAHGTQRLNELGVSVLIFPEGTRVNPGQEKKFSAGGAELAIAAGVRVLPVAHNAGHCWPGRRLMKYPGTIDLVIGEAIDTTGRSPKELIQEVEAWIRQTLEELESRQAQEKV